MADVDGDLVVRGMPARRIRSFTGQRHYPGLFWSATMAGHVWYESRLELERLWVADFDPDVAWIASQPMWLSGLDGATRRNHVPDFLLHRRDGTFVLVDVKPDKFARKPEVAAVFEWTARVAAVRGWRFEVWTGGDPVVLANLRTLAVGRRPDLVDHEALRAATAVGETGMSIGEILAVIPMGYVVVDRCRR